MTLLQRTLPTRLGAEDKFIDLYVIGLTFFQVLNVLAGAALAAEILVDHAFTDIPAGVRQVFAVLAVVIGVWAAFWRYEGHSVWAWLWMAARHLRLPRQAVSRPAPVLLTDNLDDRWYEVRPALAWSESSTGRAARSRRRA